MLYFARNITSISIEISDFNVFFFFPVTGDRLFWSKYVSNFLFSLARHLCSVYSLVNATRLSRLPGFERRGACLLKNSPYISSMDCRGFARRRWDAHKYSSNYLGLIASPRCRCMCRLQLYRAASDLLRSNAGTLNLRLNFGHVTRSPPSDI